MINDQSMAKDPSTPAATAALLTNTTLDIIGNCSPLIRLLSLSLFLLSCLLSLSSPQIGDEGFDRCGC